MKTAKKIFLWVLVGFVVIQFIPVDRSNKPVVKTQNFVDIYQTPQKVQELLKNSCYDCHSNETNFPNYAYVAPISWSIKNHINEGREHLNFSEWAGFNKDLKKNMLESTVADLKQNRMPLQGYIAQHPKARLSDAEKVVIVDYFEEILKSGKY